MIMVKSLHLENLQRRIVWFSLVGAVVNISLNLVLIPRFGINGAATASVVSGFCAVIVAPAIHPATRAEVWLIVRSPMFVLRSVRLLSA
jgi:O-antigen/teichoic acid export membrane protein